MIDSDETERPLTGAPSVERADDVDTLDKQIPTVSMTESEILSSAVRTGGQPKQQTTEKRGFRGSERRNQWSVTPAPEPSGSSAGPDAAQEPVVPRSRKSAVVIGAVSTLAVCALVVTLADARSKPGSSPVATARTGAEQAKLVNLAPGFTRASAVPTNSATATTHAPSSPARTATPASAVATNSATATANEPSSSARTTTPAKTAGTTPVNPAPSTVPPPADNWIMNEATGNVAADATGGHNGWAESAWWAGGNGCLFNGDNSQIYVNGPVLDTGSGASFTVSAWVVLTAKPANSANATAVSQDGGEESGFFLQYSGGADRWAFTRVGADTVQPGGLPGAQMNAHEALSTGGPSLGNWTHLVGVYDAFNHTEHLYVDGIAQGTATDSTPFASGGDFVIGRGMENGKQTGWFKGSIKQVEVFHTALNAAQVAKL